MFFVLRRLLCWLFHQLRFGENQPDPALVAAAAPPPGIPVDGEVGFFHSSCVKPLYRLIKTAAQVSLARRVDSFPSCARETA